MDSTGAEDFAPIWTARRLRLAAVLGWAMGLGVTLMIELPLLLVSYDRNDWTWSNTYLYPPLAGLTFGLAAWQGVRQTVARRRNAGRQPWPPGGEAFLEQNCPYFAALSPDRRERFRRAAMVFLDEIPIHGLDVCAAAPPPEPALPPDAPETADNAPMPIVSTRDALRLLVAASAVIAFFGWDEWDWREAGLREVVLRPEGFEHGEHVDDDGLVTEYEQSGSYGGEGVFNGVLMLSADDLLYEAARPEEGFHVGHHECAHMYDFARHVTGGADSEKWTALAKTEWRKVTRGRSLLDDYALTDELEMFAVASEWFFTEPQALRARHPELYRALADAYRQDPAAWMAGPPPRPPSWRFGNRRRKSRRQ